MKSQEESERARCRVIPQSVMEKEPGYGSWW